MIDDEHQVEGIHPVDGWCRCVQVFVQQYGDVFECGIGNLEVVNVLLAFPRVVLIIFGDH